MTLTGRDIPDVAGSQTYQLWLIGVDEQPRSAGIFVPRPDGSVDRAFTVGADAGGVTTLAITVEPAGGSVGPTSEPQFVGQFD